MQPPTMPWGRKILNFTGYSLVANLSWYNADQFVYMFMQKHISIANQVQFITAIFQELADYVSLVCVW